MKLLAPLVAALVIAAMAAGPASAAEINIVAPRSGESKSIDFESLASKFDVDAEYLIRGASGKTITERVRGISVAKLLAEVGADEVYSGLEIARPGRPPIVLSKVQILAAGATPAIYVSGGKLVFIRPSYGPDDVNANDIVSEIGALTLRQTDLGALNIEVKASRRSARTGQRLEFSASASGGGAGRSYTYRWNFNDGTTGSGAATSHKFAKRGTYRVLVAVKAEGADRSDAKVIEIQIGAATRSKKKRVGGGTNDAAAAPVSGAADGDSGSGAQAATARSNKRKKRRASATADSSLERVAGQVLLSATTEPLGASSTLAARSGGAQPVKPKSSGLGISTAAWAAIAGVLILAFGAALENGRFRLRKIS